MISRKGLSSSNRYMAQARRRDPLPAAPVGSELPDLIRRPASAPAGRGHPPMTTTNDLTAVPADALGIERELAMDHAAHLHDAGMLAEGEAPATVEHAVVPAPTRQGLGRSGRPQAGTARPVDRGAWKQRRAAR